MPSWEKMAKIAEKLKMRHFGRLRPGRVKTGFREKTGVFEKNGKVGKMRFFAFLREIGPFGSGSAATSSTENREKKTTFDQIELLMGDWCSELLPLQLASKWLLFQVLKSN